VGVGLHVLEHEGRFSGYLGQVERVLHDDHDVDVVRVHL
jgi:hypothetical protein